MNALTLRPRALLGGLMAAALLLAGPAPSALAQAEAPKPSPSAKPADGEDAFGFGASVGAGMPGGWPNVQGNSAFWLRWGGSWHEGMLGLTGRSQALSANRSSVFETSGLQLAYGLRAWNLHAGLSASGELLREIVPNEAAPGEMRFHNGAGVVVEPYVALDLFRVNPFQVQVMGFWPVWQMLKSDSVGPRVMLTLWVAPGDKEGDDEPSPSPSTETSSSEGGKSVGPEEEAGPEGAPGEIIQPNEAANRPSTAPAPSAAPNPRATTRPVVRPTPRPGRR